MTNDDGVHAPGLLAARTILAAFGDVIAVVPDREMSGASHALTLHHPLRMQPAGDAIWVVNGTPTDCVNLALNRLLKEPPALVFSGINRGSNVGFDVSYSGTVAGALEGALHGVPSLAVSIEAAGDLADAGVATAITWVLERILRAGTRNLLLNVNLPAGEIRGIRATVQGRGGYRSEIVVKVDPRGNEYYWIGGHHAHDLETRPHSDLATLRAGYVSVTPLGFDTTDHQVFAELQQSWFAHEGATPA